MLNLVLKTGDRIQIGDNVIVKLQSDSRAQLAIDAPKEVNIKRLPPETEEEKPKKKKFILQDPDQEIKRLVYDSVYLLHNKKYQKVAK